MAGDESGRFALTEPQASGGTPTRAGAALLESERRDLQERLREHRRASRRHTVWALLGVSPAAVVPLLAVANEFGVGIACVFSLFVAATEAWRAIQARMDAKEIEKGLKQISSALDGPGS